MMPFITTLTGASSSGKSYLIDKITEISKELTNIPFRPVSFPKYTTREYRVNEILKMQKNEFVDVISVNEIPDECDLMYRFYGNEYGLNTKDLGKELSNNKHPIVVINDVRAVEELRKIFNGRVLSLFLFRHVPNIKEFKNESNKRGNISEEELLERYLKAIALYRIYIENITTFDRVILNVKNEEIDVYKCTKLQIKNVLKGVFDKKIPLNKKHPKGTKLFIISGNSTSGKDDVNLAIQKMGKLQAKVISKYTSRHQEKNDASEMICQFIPKTDLIKNYNAEYNQEKNKIHEYYLQSIPQHFIDDCKSAYNEDINVTFEEFYNALWNLQRSKSLGVLQTPLKRFWNEQSDIIDSFVRNNKYINLDALEKKFDFYNPKKKDELCFVGKYKNKEYIVYKNHGNQVKYAFSIDGLLQKMHTDQKHRVLVASFVNLFEYCKEKIGNNKVIPIFSYSQISKSDYEERAKSEIEKLKIQSHDDLKRYSENIVDFKHVIIFAETQMERKTGGQKEELIDQMFRLFKSYNK